MAAATAAADSVTDLAKRLSGLRGEVETLSGKLAAKDTEFRDQLRSYARQKIDLEAELKREQTRVQKLHLAISEKKKIVEEEKGQDDELKPLFEKTLKQVRGYVEGSLPFRTQERLAELKKLEGQYQSGLLTPPRAVSRLWTFLEDEFRMTRENGLYQQTIVIGGEEQLADVARLGMVMLFFRTSQSDVGHAVREGNAWKFQTINSPEQRKLVLNLFDSMKKQIRVGYFELPNALAAGAAQ